ncbi:hypothetical protein BKN37_03605 [Mycobacterium talmoniae]|uniref:DUF4190 domain-containing protein n=1 Tax=Mycobacterium talmoniae TaxID=1858794 RepID=A0A1S1NNW2_9MYCO|nr:hypothetical protein BKN37_03605 [Mycobacterium talmoniae]
MRQPPSVWTVVGAALGAAALALAIVPFYGAVSFVVAGEAAAVGGLGVAAATAGLAQARRNGRIVSAPAVAGAVAAALAVVLGVMAVTGQVISVRDQPRRPTLDTATVLGRELAVTVGGFDYTGSDSYSLSGGLAVTLRNKLNTTRSFRIAVAAFDRDRHQVMSTSSSATLAAHATESVEMFTYLPDEKTADRLKAATFRLIDASSKPVT